MILVLNSFGNLSSPIRRVAKVLPFLVGRASPLTTWYKRMLVSFGISFNKASTVPAGSLAKAASFGAKTVSFSDPERAPKRLNYYDVDVE